MTTGVQAGSTVAHPSLNQWLVVIEKSVRGERSIKFTLDGTYPLGAIEFLRLGHGRAFRLEGRGIVTVNHLWDGRSRLDERNSTFWLTILDLDCADELAHWLSHHASGLELVDLAEQPPRTAS
ncbi:MAG: hypothetical protein HYY50_01085 [Candidatus Kerfeldbacteria bacterium]|nr:hypothetical protein [Candidatus Kerfeldbacteria bacterium]